MLPPNTPDLTTLDLLGTVAELGSLGQAAIRHRISQPAVSMKMTQLEKRLGLTLLLRDQTGTRLTPEGEQVVIWAQRVVATTETMMAAVGALRAEKGAHLRVASSFTIAEYLLGGWIGELSDKSPDLALTLEVSNSASVLQRVHEGTVDIGFIESTETKVPTVTTKLVGRDRLVVVVDPNHPWSRRKSPVSGSELASTEVLTREFGSGTREVLETALRPWGGLRSRREFGSTTTILNIARMGGGPAVLSAIAAKDDLDSGRLVVVETTDLDLARTFQAVWLKDRTLADLARRLLTIATRQVTQTHETFPDESPTQVTPHSK